MQTGNKTNSGEQQQMPQPDMQPPMGGEEDAMPAMDDTMQDPSMDNMQQPTDNNVSGQSEFDTNFDAGVEADEDTDPKRYIQQLTGKLSTTLNTYNNENDDDGLNKYVAKMIVKQATKHMDDATKKEIIKAINTSSEQDVDKDDSDNATGEPEMGQQESIQEMILRKSDILKLQEGLKNKLKK